MPDTQKRFDSVEMMRSLRDDLSNKIEYMTYKEERDWLDSQPLNDPLLERLRNTTDGQSSAESE